MSTLSNRIIQRLAEAAGRPIITYCAACAGTYGKRTASLHLLDLWISPKDALAGKTKASVAPITYLNRIMLKSRFRRTGTFAVMRERRGSGSTEKGSSRSKAATLLLMIAAMAIIFRLSGATRLLDPETLRHLLVGHEILGPLLFVLLYTVTPVLFLPGLPMTIAAGVLFGPVWGVIYAITGATLGASASFLVARYLARDWVEAKLTGVIWKNLDHKVGEQGWKIVALTRLVPLFPFNLLNYAYGVTRIPFLHYVVASFICMLPACIAFIVFSSSLPQLLRGKVSATLVIGTILVAVIMLVPMLYRKRLLRQETEVHGCGD